MAITTAFSPAGSTVAAPFTATAATFYVTSLTPVNTWYLVNSSSNPVQVRFGANLASPVTAVFPVSGTPSLGPIVNGNDAQLVQLPTVLRPDASTFGGFVSNVQISVIGLSTGNLYVTPVVALTN